MCQSPKEMPGSEDRFAESFGRILPNKSKVAPNLKEILDGCAVARQS